MLEFARTGARVGATSATLEKTRLLANYLVDLDDDDLRRAAQFMSGRAFGASRSVTLGLGWAALSKAVSELSERGEDDLTRLYRKHSDLGDWAGEALEGKTMPDSVSLREVEEALDAIRAARGARKAAVLKDMLRRLDRRPLGSWSRSSPASSGSA